MRVLKVLLGILGAIALIFVALGLMGAKDFTIERSAKVDAPAEVIYKHLASFETMNAWSPWSKLDPKYDV